jgi:allantoinase
MFGHPARAAGLQRLLDHMMRHDDVWTARRIDIPRLL